MREAAVASWQTEPQRAGDDWWCYRQVASGWAPLWHSAGAPTPDQESARWNRKGVGYAQYFALEPLGAWAELIRYQSIRSEDRAAEQRRDLWSVFVREREIAQLATFDDWEACGLDPAIAVGDHAPCQALASELLDAGYRGVLAPSAALPGVVNLTLFGERYEERMLASLDSWANPDPDVFLPCVLITGPAPPPPGLTTATCFRRSPHQGYRRWLAEKGLTASAGYP